ncbi:MAG: Acetoin utilization protein AcuC [Alphaproteobacteria bacterium MarineAlpha9_Bin4]|nr:hypothetical protein [Pelagibacterales bacterium]PPR26006.1 MAG: Acetoin utilization protein AcuC [Alphaproteobacteria bacterium MarineAlpha9_Bin4]|tara:strand:+ start:555 stop:1598 length:1044 start_codon:yes stop_codon:yes gene_type:complete
MSVAFIYNDIYRYSNFGNYHPVLPKRISNVYDFTQLLNIRNNLNFFFNDVADFNTLELFHSKDYLEVLIETEKSQKISKDNSKKYNLGTTSNPIFKEMFRRHATSTGALVLAVDLIEKNYNYIFSPGSGAHHGKVNMASGFCYLNDIAVSILVLKLKGYNKILYFDMDAHYGDGVIDYFKYDSDVFTISIHQEDLWPRTGLYKEDLKNNILNLPVKRGFNDYQFKKLIDKNIFKKIDKFRPQIVLMQMGADCLIGDKMSALELSNNSMAYIIRKIKILCDKIIVMGGGGYNPWVTLRAWIYNLAELVGADYPLTLDKHAIEFLKNINYNSKPKDFWLNSIQDKPNIF